MFKNNFLLVVAFLLLLTGCSQSGSSGDGSDSNGSPNADLDTDIASDTSTDTSIDEPTQTSQSITILNTAPFKLFLGQQAQMDVKKGPGSGSLVFYSQDSNIAEVTEQGLITITGIGETTIEVRQLEDTEFSEAEASLSIISVDNKMTVKAFVGKSGAEVHPIESLSGIELFSSNSPECELNNVSSCRNGELINISDTSFQVAALNLEDPAHMTLVHGEQEVSVTLDAQTYEYPAEAATVFFNNKFWIFGGFKHGQVSNEIWSSENGVEWQQHSSLNAFTPRYGHSVTEFKGELWLIGGAEGGAKNDIWKSSNGIEWVKTTDLPDQNGLF